MQKIHKLILGKKLCCKCYKELDSLWHSDFLADGNPVYGVEGEVYIAERLNKSLVHLDCTTIKKLEKIG